MADNQSKNRTIADLRQKYQSLVQYQSLVIRSYDDLAAKHGILEMDYAELDKKNEKISGNLTELKRENADLKNKTGTEIAGLQKEIRELKADSLNKTKKIAELQKRINGLQKENDMLKKASAPTISATFPADAIRNGNPPGDRSTTPSAYFDVVSIAAAHANGTAIPLEDVAVTVKRGNADIRTALFGTGDWERIFSDADIIIQPFLGNWRLMMYPTLFRIRC